MTHPSKIQGIIEDNIENRASFKEGTITGLVLYPAEERKFGITVTSFN
jgi:hypothetical protein